MFPPSVPSPVTCSPFAEQTKVGRNCPTSHSAVSNTSHLKHTHLEQGPLGMGTAPRLPELQKHLDTFRHRVGLLECLRRARSWTLWSWWVPSKPGYSLILWPFTCTAGKLRINSSSPNSCPDSQGRVVSRTEHRFWSRMQLLYKFCSIAPWTSNPRSRLAQQVLELSCSWPPVRGTFSLTGKCNCKLGLG